MNIHCCCHCVVDFTSEDKQWQSRSTLTVILEEHFLLRYTLAFPHTFTPLFPSAWWFSMVQQNGGDWSIDPCSDTVNVEVQASLLENTWLWVKANYAMTHQPKPLDYNKIWSDICHLKDVIQNNIAWYSDNASCNVQFECWKQNFSLSAWVIHHWYDLSWRTEKQRKVQYASATIQEAQIAKTHSATEESHTKSFTEKCRTYTVGTAGSFLWGARVAC